MEEGWGLPVGFARICRRCGGFYEAENRRQRICVECKLDPKNKDIHEKPINTPSCKAYWKGTLYWEAEA